MTGPFDESTPLDEVGEYQADAYVSERAPVEGPAAWARVEALLDQVLIERAERVVQRHAERMRRKFDES